MTEGRPARIAVYGFFGMGNLGNEGSLAAFLLHLRTNLPAAEVRCFAGDVETVRREHGLPTTLLMASGPADARGVTSYVTKALLRLWDVPRTFRLMRGTDLLVVPGMGVLESKFATSPWGMPLWLLAAVASCRVRGGRVAILSIGADVPESPVTRRFFRWTITLADYCSYRDAGSQEAARTIGVRGRLGPVRPDLAFSLPEPSVAAVRPGHVVVGVMVYEGEPHMSVRGPELVREYVDKMTTAVGRLVDAGRTVTLVVGDLADNDLAEEIGRRARAGRDAASVVVSRAASLTELMVEMGRAEVVVASRFHNVLCALKMARPVVSLSYAAKNRELQAEFGLHDLDQPIEAFDVDLLLEQVERASGLGTRATLSMRTTADGYRDVLAAQYDEALDLAVVPELTAAVR